MKLKMALSLMFGLLFISPSYALLKPRLSYATGSNGFNSFGVSAKIGSQFYLEPSYRSYSVDTASGTFKTYSLRSGVDFSNWGIGVEAGVQPENNGYKNSFLGVDSWFETPIIGTQSSGSNDQVLLTLGLGVMGTEHVDKLQSASLVLSGAGLGAHQNVGSLKKGADDVPTAPRSSAEKIQQTDLDLSVGLEFFSLASFDVGYTKSVYDKNLQSISAREINDDHFTGGISIIGGYRKSLVTSRVTLLSIPVMAPYVSYSKISFELNEPKATSVGVGTSISLKPFQMSVGYEIYDPGAGASKNHYTSIGGSVRF